MIRRVVPQHERFTAVHSLAGVSDNMAGVLNGIIFGGLTYLIAYSTGLPRPSLIALGGGLLAWRYVPRGGA